MRDDCKKWSLLEEISWRQKSRELWLKVGDRSISFFYKMANSHRRRNAEKKTDCNKRFLVPGSWFTEDSSIQKGVVDTFQNLLSDPGGWCPEFLNIPFNVIDEEDSNRIEGKFTEEELLAAISGLDGEKVPGPDGFPNVLWSFSWDFVKKEVMSFFKDFYE